MTSLVVQDSDLYTRLTDYIMENRAAPPPDSFDISNALAMLNELS